MPMELGPHTCADEAKAQCETTHQERASLVTEKKRLKKEVNLWAHRAIEVEAGFRQQGVREAGRKTLLCLLVKQLLLFPFQTGS